MDLNPENNKDTFRERDKKIEELELQLKILKEEKAALESIIRMTYLSIGCNSDVIETEDWGSLPSRVARLKSEAEVAIYNSKLLDNNIDTLESMIDTALYDVEYEDCHLFLKKEFQSYIDETYGIKDDSWYKDHKDPGNYRAAKTPTRKRK